MAFISLLSAWNTILSSTFSARRFTECWITTAVLLEIIKISFYHSSDIFNKVHTQFQAQFKEVNSFLGDFESWVQKKKIL